MKPIYRPGRFAYLLPIFWMQAQFDDMTMGLFFGLAMAYITAKMFPWIEYPKTKEENKE